MEIASLSAGLALQLGTTATQELKKRGVRLLLPDIAEETIEAVHDEILNAPQGLGAGAQSLRDQATERLSALGVEVA